LLMNIVLALGTSDHFQWWWSLIHQTLHSWKHHFFRFLPSIWRWPILLASEWSLDRQRLLDILYPVAKYWPHAISLTASRMVSSGRNVVCDS
jgi:hypothetical protein